MKSIQEVYKESTCQKRVTIVELYDVEGNLLSRESNRCSPEGGVCHRLEVTQSKDNYDIHSHCNWIHAEIMAIQSLPENSKPYRAVLFGHDFYCDACETALKKVGVGIFDISKKRI
jgi:hypothetical protein